MSESIDPYAQEREEQLSYKQAVLDLLCAANIAKVLIYYDGGGDNGQIESVMLLDADGQKLADRPLSNPVPRFSETLLLKHTLEGALEAYAWTLLAIHHDGFEDNDGGYGTIIIEVLNERVTIAHNARVMDILSSTTEV